ncbi:hypothetical protein ABIE26_000170 [Pedobacter africanus]|uniref:Uncharacterized protein n=1 Tax=Pedobacter africanus TaxID=151894 RepID=A0ACC6KVS8_9SPHI|nr:hypothetical protein [Pedobacter africanus]
MPPTQPMLDQRFKFGLMNGWLNRISKLVKPDFADYGVAMSAVNACVGYNLKRAITGVSPNFTIDYSKVLYSRGKLDLPNNPLIATTTAAKLDYSWLAVTGDTNSKPTDKVTFMVYNTDKDKFVTLQGIVVRSALAYSLQLPPDWSGDNVEAYLSLALANGEPVRKIEPYLMAIVLVMVWFTAQKVMLYNDSTAGQVDQSIWLLVLLAIISFLLIQGLCFWQSKGWYACRAG